MRKIEIDDDNIIIKAQAFNWVNLVVGGMEIKIHSSGNGRVNIDFPDNAKVEKQEGYLRNTYIIKRG